MHHCNTLKSNSDIVSVKKQLVENSMPKQSCPLTQYIHFDHAPYTAHKTPQMNMQDIIATYSHFLKMSNMYIHTLG